MYLKNVLEGRGDVVLNCCCSPMETTVEDDPRQPFSIPLVQQEAWDLLALKCWESHAENTASHLVGCIRVPTHSMEEGWELCSSTETVACVSVSRAL